MPQTAHSFAQTISLTCPQCSQPFDAQIWLIVDAAQRPDLLEMIEQETLHDLSCPHCSASARVDASLLVHRPGQDPALIFSPAQGTTPEHDQEQVNGLLGWLHEQLGDAWQDGWLEQLPALPRPALAIALKEGLPAAARRMQADMQAQLERLRQEDPQAYEHVQAEARRRAEAAPLLPILQEFIAASSWEESQRYLEAHLDLLSEETDQLLEAFLQRSGAQGDEDAQRILEEHRLLLQRCRVIGIPGAFAEKIDSLPPEHSAQIEAEQEFQVGQAQEPDLHAPVQVIAAAGPLGEALLELLNASSIEDSQQIVMRRPELLKDAAGRLLERLNEAEPRPQARRMLHVVQVLLQRCQEIGIEAAFDEIKKASNKISPL